VFIRKGGKMTLNGIFGNEIKIDPALIQKSKKTFNEQMKKEVALLVDGKIDEYKKCHDDFEKLKIPNYQISLMDELFGSDLVGKVGRPTISTFDYMSNFHRGRFMTQDIMTEYLSYSLDNLIKDNAYHFREHGIVTGYEPEYPLKYGRCDFFIKGKTSVLLELKKDIITRKDIFQCQDFYKSVDKKIPVAVIGSGLQKGVPDYAKEVGITIYTYTIPSIAPTVVNVNFIQGKQHAVIDKMGGFFYIFKPWSDFV
jgi:hypothetical protein